MVRIDREFAIGKFDNVRQSFGDRVGAVRNNQWDLKSSTTFRHVYIIICLPGRHNQAMITVLLGV